ncbi:MCE family protein [Actinomadura scrupuli]|uniref:MCE family protein n=1 Tax=Actinomadura scrupuli TaxID=559629 RepID=UPI003D980E6B
MTRRIQVNLAVFALLGTILSVWALRNVLRFDAFSHPYRISAQFASSPGLQPGFDVTYLGVAVGKIRSVRLDGPKVTVQLSIDKNQKIPQGVTAAAALKSAIGEPFIDLEPSPGQAGAPPMRPGDTIPLARTSVSETYGDLFAGVNKAINGLNPENLRIVSHELALGLDGRGDSLRLTVDGASQLAGTFARNTGTLDGLITNLSSLTRVLAGRHADLATGISSTADLTASLAEVDDALVQIRDNTPDLLARSARLLREAGPAMRCLISTLDTALPVVLSKGNVDDFTEGLRWSPQLADAMTGVLTYVNGDPNLNIKFIITPTPVKTAVEYRDLRPLPTIPRIPTCPGITLPKQQIPPMSKPAAAKSNTRKTAATPEPAQIATRDSAGSEHHDPMSWLIYIPPVVAALILLRVLMNTLRLTWRPSRRRKSK